MSSQKQCARLVGGALLVLGAPQWYLLRVLGLQELDGRVASWQNTELVYHVAQH